MPDVLDFEDDLRRVLNDRAAAIDPQLSAGDIRNGAGSGADVRIRFAPLLSAAAIAAAAALIAVLTQGTGSHGEGQRRIQPVASATAPENPRDIVAGCTSPPGVFGDGVRHAVSPGVTLLLADGALPKPGKFPVLGWGSDEDRPSKPRGNTVVVVGPAKGSTVPRVLAAGIALKVGERFSLLIQPDDLLRFQVSERQGYTRAQGLPAGIFTPPPSDQLVLISCGTDTESDTADHDDIVVMHARAVH